MTVWAASSTRREKCSVDSRSAMYTLDLETHLMSIIISLSRQKDRAACIVHTRWRVSRALECCWRGRLRWPVEASPTASLPAASGGRKSRKYEPQCCCGREGQVRLTLRSLNINLMHKRVWTPHSCLRHDNHPMHKESSTNKCFFRLAVKERDPSNAFEAWT